jgi:3-hydroxybutyryl-CoA dehydrogenase
MDENNKFSITDLVESMPQPKREEGHVEYVGILGGGIMGQGIAQTISSAGIDVLIVEKNDQRMERSIKDVSEDMDREIQRWGMTKSEKQAILSRIRGTIDITEVAPCDFVVEAVDEDFELKKNVFRKLDQICSPNTIIVSNTATLSLTEIAKVTGRPDKIVGMHFLNPVPKIPLVELVRGLKTSDDTLSRTKRFAERLGKTVVEVYEYPGFVTTRVIVPMLNEAMNVLMEGIASADGIDTAIKLGYNFTTGPLELADTMGLDEVMAWMEQLFRELGDLRYRPCPLLRKLVREGKLGKKSGEGFFRYDANKKKMNEQID